MKFPPFEYVRPASLVEAVDALASCDDAKALAGGQSLLPLLALRLARPSLLVELSDLGLDRIEAIEDSPVVGGPALSIGAMVRQSRLFGVGGLLAAAAANVGHRATRNRGTFVGSLAHADPAAELPAAAVALGAVAQVTGPGGTRAIPCNMLAEGYFTTVLAEHEIITDVHVPVWSGRSGAAFCEWAPRAGDFAEVGIGVALGFDADGRCDRIRAAGCGLGSVPADLGPVLIGVLGEEQAGPSLLRHVAEEIGRATHGADNDKSELSGLLGAFAVKQAFEGAAR